MTAPRQRVLNFFDIEIKQYVLEDLKVLSEIRPDKKTGLRGCTIPQSMLIFAILDLIGYLIRDDKNANKSQTIENYKAIFSKELELFPDEYEKERVRIVKLFRHGIMHQFFPKASGILKGSRNPSLIFEQDNIPQLNVDKFTKDFQAALLKLNDMIKSGKHDILAERINQRLDILNKEDYEEGEVSKPCIQQQ